MVTAPKSDAGDNRHGGGNKGYDYPTVLPCSAHPYQHRWALSPLRIRIIFSLESEVLGAELEGLQWVLRKAVCCSVCLTLGK